ncbi:MTAP family purine nucleoside phosphorylase [bacterium]|nr:MTAP family purine nucleoside phosphorylase [bacterium]
MWAIIGGSGFEKFDEFKALENFDRSTPFGLCSEGIKKGLVAGKEVLFLPRHGLHHDLSPSEVNYRANIFALKKHGARQILAFSAVGSLRNELPPGDMVVPSQYINFTKNRISTFSGEGLVSHTSLAIPVSLKLVEATKKIASQMSFRCHFDKVSLVVEGPYFSTKAESHLFRAWGADIIGMTAFPEYALAREAGLAFLPCGFVTDYDCWKDDIPHVTVQEVMETMKKNNLKAFEIAKKIVNIDESILQAARETENGLKNSMMTPSEKLSAEQKKWIQTLIS